MTNPRHNGRTCPIRRGLLGVEPSLLSFPSPSPAGLASSPAPEETLGPGERVMEAEEVAAMREETELRNAEYAAREADRREDEDAGASD